jgi:glycosyltransferase involved in cell wall biosynthesis
MGATHKIMRAVNLSYIIATHNRLPFLKITLEKLVSELQSDEEIIVVDGDSVDGTKDYLQQLYNAGKIQHFVSEPDKNQAHGWNKAMLLANGTILKKIIDDDVFCYEAIRICKAYMLEHAAVDVVISDDLSGSLYDSAIISKHTRLPQYKKWRSGLMPSFTFRDVNILMRRSSLSFIGLYNTDFIMMDWEYALRISYFKANIVYYTGCNALTVGHNQTVSSLKSRQLIIEQGKKAEAFYAYAGDGADITYWSIIKIAVGKLIHKTLPGKAASDFNPKNISDIYNHFYEALAEANKNVPFTFLDSH